MKTVKEICSLAPAISVLVTGSINPENVSEYLSLSNVLCVGGSWIAPAELVNSSDWSAIQALAKQASTLNE